MNEWTIRIAGADTTADEQVADALIEALATYAPAVSYGHGQIAVTLAIAALSPQEAIAQALSVFGAARAGVVIAHVEAHAA